jgi:Cu-processing system permease protein
MTADLWAMARLEFVAAARLKWIRLLTAAFALLAGAAAYSAGAANDVSGADGFARTTMALVPVVLVLVPLASLVLGVTGQTSEAGGEPFLFSQPVSRGTVVLGRWLGESAALAAAIGAGLGIGGLLVVSGSGVDGLPQFVFFVAMAILLAIIFLSIAAAVAAASSTRVIALGAATFAWVFFVLVYDGAALSLAGWITGRIGGRVLFASVFGNPADLIRIVTLTTAGTPAVLGAAGESWIRFLGGPTGAWLAAAAAVTTWMLAPIATAIALMNRRDL